VGLRLEHLATAVAGAGGARAAWTLLQRRPPGGRERWQRTNHRGELITLLEGPALAAGAVAALAVAPVGGRLRTAGTIAVTGAAAFGVLDDLTECGTSKGLRGHLGALARGEVTTGGVKIAGIGATGLAAALVALGPRGPAREVLPAAALVAGCANLANLFDLRPGRALKVALLPSPALLSAAPAGGLVAAVAGPAVALLREDLGERAMLGDGGANAAGALLGVGLVAGAPPRLRWAALCGVVGLTLASEKVSFTKVIEATPVLRELDMAGRRPR
jgi:UDP-GlcNAc:undecaprenyl-phosphate/decaprenyl-phosphate GlcNAc-1-phosphate transferase